MTKAIEGEIKKLELDITQVTRTKSLLSANQIQKIWNSTPQRYKYSRPAKGGGSWTYIKASYVRKVLDSVFGFNWDIIRTTTTTEIQEWIKMGVKQIIVDGYIEARVKDDGTWIPIKKYGTGRADIKFRKDTVEPLDLGNDVKAAESDLLKKCASKFGIGADVYETDEFQAIEITGSDDNTDRAKATKQKLKDLRAEEVK